MSEPNANFEMVKTPDGPSIDRFWDWFRAHRSNFDALDGSDAPFWDVALGQLQRLDDRLWFELSCPKGTDREFIITAEGKTQVFPLVDDIVRRAPAMEGWRFFALKPPMGFAFKTNYEGIDFDPRAMWFLPLQSFLHPQELGMRVGVPNYAVAIKRQAANAVLVILDTALGERSAAVDIQHVEVGALPGNPAEDGYIELPELSEYIEWRKRRTADGC